MFNWIFCLGIAVGIAARFYDGKVISMTAGLAAGVVLVEIGKHVMWYLSK